MSTKATPAFHGFGIQGKDEKKGDAKRSFKVPEKKKGLKLVSQNKDTIVDLKGSLDRQPKFAKMVLYSVGCVDKLAVDINSAEEIINEGMVESLMNVLKQNPNNEEIAQAVNRVLKNLCKDGRLAEMVLARMRGDYSALNDSLRNHVDPETLKTTASLIGVLTKSATREQLEAMSRGGMHQGLCNLIVKGKGNKDLLAAGADALCRFGELPRLAGAIMGSGAVGAILDEMRAHPENLKIVRPGVALIANLCKNSPEATEQLKKMGAVDILVAALEAHPYNDEITELAAEALKHLTGATDMDLALANLTKGDVPLDAKAARDMARVAALMLVPENVDYLHRSHGTDWLHAVLKNGLGKNDANASKILANGCRVLMRAATDEHKVYDTLKKGGVQLLCGIINGHLGDDKVTESALTALAKLVTRKENAVYVAQCGGIKAAIQAYNAHPENENLARAALDLFNAMAKFPEMGDALTKQGVIKAAMDILKAHMNNPDICNAAIQTLGRLATSADNVQEMVNQGLLPTLLGVLKKHNDPELVNNAMMAMETTMLLPEVNPKLKKLNAIPVIEDKMAEHEGDPMIQEVGARILDGLKVDPEEVKAKEKKAAEEAKQAADNAERERVARMEQERQDKEMKAKKEAEAEAEKARLEAERKKRLREADEARLRAEKEEQRRIDAEMQAALDAMQASQAAAKLRALDEEKRAKDAEKGKIAAEMEAARLKQLDDQRRLDDIEKKRRELELMRKKAKEKADEDAAERHILALSGRKGEKEPKEPKAPKLKKSARELFEADDDKDKKLAILPPPIKNFLCAGQLLKKHSKKANAKSMHLFLSPDLEWMCWKNPDPKAKFTLKHRMRIYKLYGVNTGRCTPQLQRKRMGRFITKEECCFSIYGGDLYKEERTVDFETPTPKDCQAWVHALEVLIEYAKNRPLWGGETVAMRTDKELNKMGYKEIDKDEEGAQMTSMADMEKDGGGGGGDDDDDEEED